MAARISLGHVKITGCRACWSSRPEHRSDRTTAKVSHLHSSISASRRTCIQAQATRRCSAANWAERAQKVRSREGDWPLARGLLLSYEIQVEPVLVDDAERAAMLWRAGGGLSLADRLCLATAERLDATVWTADMASGNSERVRQVR